MKYKNCVDEQAKKNSDIVRSVIAATNGRIFTAKFIKRGDGGVRVMQARIGVKKFKTPNGNGRPWKDKDYNLTTVYDMKELDYRSIPHEGVYEIKCGKMVVHLTGDDMARKQLRAMANILKKHMVAAG